MWCNYQLFPFIILALYYLDVTIVNDYGKKVVVLTTHSDPAYKRFEISVGGRYQIKSTSAAKEKIYITALYGAINIPITIDGKIPLSVSSSAEPKALTFYIPEGKKRTFPMYIRNSSFKYASFGIILYYFNSASQIYILPFLISNSSNTTTTGFNCNFTNSFHWYW